jgi:hypothetical protein
MHIRTVALTRAGIFLSMLFSVAAIAGEEDEIVTGCHFSNAEWGQQMIDNCIKDNFANRALVLQYPEQHKSIVNRCRLKNEYGWSEVKKCIDKDIDAQAALKSYGADKENLVAICDREFGVRGFVAVKACVDKKLGVTEEKNKM